MVVDPVVEVAVEPVARSKSFHIASLDGIRGVAFLLVFLAHTGLGFVIPGGFGVTVFFVLSGFLITTLLRVEFEESGRIDFKAFYIRRALRILPLYYLVFGFAVVMNVAGFTSGSIHPMGTFSQLLNWSNYYLIGHDAALVPGGTVVLWSLAVEEHFYLLFPLLYWLTSKYLSRKAQIGLLWTLCIVCLIWRCVLLFGLHGSTVRNELGTDTRYDGLLFGALLAVAANPVLDPGSWPARGRQALYAAIGFAVLVFTFSWRNDDFRFTFRFTLQAMALVPIFAYAIMAKASPVYRFLNWKAMTQLGVLSYALYLLHAILLNMFSGQKPHAGVVAGLATFVSALLLAKLLQVTVERPLQRLRRRFSRIHA